jgi:hypothetical protein
MLLVGNPARGWFEAVFQVEKRLCGSRILQRMKKFIQNIHVNLDKSKENTIILSDFGSTIQKY